MNLKLKIYFEVYAHRNNHASRFACGSHWDPTTSCPFLMTHVTRCCVYQRCVLGMIIYQFAPSRTFVTIIPYLSWTILLTTLPTCSHSLSLVPPPSTINTRRYSYFVHVCFIWNKFPIELLKIDNIIVLPFIVLLLNIFVILLLYLISVQCCVLDVVFVVIFVLSLVQGQVFFAITSFIVWQQNPNFWHNLALDSIVVFNVELTFQGH